MKHLRPHLFAMSVFFVATPFAGCHSIARKAVLPGSFLRGDQAIVNSDKDSTVARIPLANGTRVALRSGYALTPSGEMDPMFSERPSIVFLYGNQMSIAGSDTMFQDLRRMGLNVIIPDYPGYGMSDGIPSEKGCYEAAQKGLETINQDTRIRNRTIYVAGLSIGCGVAVELAVRNKVDGVVLVVPLPSIRKAGEDHLPVLLRWTAPLIAREISFDNLRKLPALKCPALFVSATRDQVTSKARSEEIAKCFGAGLRHIEVNSDHDGAWDAARSEIAQWFLQRQLETSKQQEQGELTPRT